MLPSDVDRLIEVLRHDVGLRLLANRSLRPEPVETESPVHTEAGFTRVDCLLAPDYASSVKLDHLDKQNLWSVNTLFSEVVEFSGCHFNDKTLKSGRLFYDKGFYSDKQWQEKSPRFLKWADLVFQTAKKSVKRVSSLDAYIGKDAERWHSAGGVLVTLSIKDHSPTGT